MQGSTRNEIVSTFMNHWVAVFGAPRVILTDNNEQFKGRFMEMCKEQEILKESGLRHTVLR